MADDFEGCVDAAAPTPMKDFVIGANGHIGGNGWKKFVLIFQLQSQNKIFLQVVQRLSNLKYQVPTPSWKSLCSLFFILNSIFSSSNYLSEFCNNFSFFKIRSKWSPRNARYARYALGRRSRYAWFDKNKKTENEKFDKILIFFFSKSSK